MDIDLQGKLLAGSNIAVKDITIINYKAHDIFRVIGVTKYLQMTNLMCRTPRDFIEPKYLKEFGDVKLFDIFCMTEEMQDLFKKAMNFFTGYEWDFVGTSAFIEFWATNENNERVHINRENCEEIFDVIKSMYCLHDNKKESQRDDIDDRMREILAEFEEEESKVNTAKGSKITLFSIIAGVATKHNSINLLNIWDYTIYQIIHSFKLLEKISNEDRTMTGIYSGTIDSKKIDLDKIHWAAES